MDNLCLCWIKSGHKKAWLNTNYKLNWIINYMWIIYIFLILLEHVTYWVRILMVHWNSRYTMWHGYHHEIKVVLLKSYCFNFSHSQVKEACSALTKKPESRGELLIFLKKAFTQGSAFIDAFLGYVLLTRVNSKVVLELIALQAM